METASVQKFIGTVLVMTGIIPIRPTIRIAALLGFEPMRLRRQRARRTSPEPPAWRTPRAEANVSYARVDHAPSRQAEGGNIST
jgi:hypothetical protein